MKKLFSFVLIIALLLGLSVCVSADSNPGSVIVSMRYGTTPVPGGTVVIYRVGDATVSNGQVTLIPTGDFSDCEGTDADLYSQELAYALTTHVYENFLTPDGTQTPDSQGVARFDDLPEGIYLIVQTEAADGYYEISPVLVAVPTYSDGNYNVLVDSKVPIYPVNPPWDPVEPDDPGENDPEESTTEDEDDWYEPEDGEEIPEVDDDEVEKLPQTGQLNWPVPIMAIAGLLVFAFGWMLRFGQKRETYES